MVLFSSANEYKVFPFSRKEKESHVLSSRKLHYHVAVTLYYSENYLPRGRHPKSTFVVSHSVLARPDMIKLLLSRRKYFRVCDQKTHIIGQRRKLLLEERLFGRFLCRMRIYFSEFFLESFFSITLLNIF